MNHKQQIKEAYKTYHQLTNMTLRELKKWKDNPCSKEASIGRTAINRNLKLLSTPKDRWTTHHMKEAKKAISFIARHKAGKKGDEVKGCGVSKRTIALKNWAFDPNK